VGNIAADFGVDDIVDTGLDDVAMTDLAQMSGMNEIALGHIGFRLDIAMGHMDYSRMDIQKLEVIPELLEHH
jgi:hypothetical protein